MSDRSITWAWQQKGLSPAVKLALLAFAREADLAGAFTLRRRDLADMLECSLDTVDRRIRALQDAKILDVEQNTTGGFQANTYRLAIPEKFVSEHSRNVAATPQTRSRKAAASPAPDRSRSLAATEAAALRPGEAATVAASNRTHSSELYSDREEVGISVGSARKRAPDKTAFNPKWTKLSAENRAYADSHGFLNGSGEALFEDFRDHHLKKGSMMADWQAAWRTWVRNAIKFKAEREAQNGKQRNDPNENRRKRHRVTADVLEAMRMAGEDDGGALPRRPALEPR